jgi:hypothetical protein
VLSCIRADGDRLIPTTRDQFLEFFRMPQPMRSTVPPSTMAFYFAILAAGHAFSPGLTSTQGLYRKSYSMLGLTRQWTAFRKPCVLETAWLDQTQNRMFYPYWAVELIPRLQAQIIYGICLFSLRRAEEHWSLLGSLLRQAQSVGLHKLAEPQSDADVSRIEVGKRIWCVNLNRRQRTNLINKVDDLPA